MFYREQVAQGEVQADAEHQQDHTDLGQLRCQFLVGDEAGREWPDDHSRQQIADQRREPDLVRERAERECEHEAGAQQGDERSVMRHPDFLQVSTSQCPAWSGGVNPQYEASFIVAMRNRIASATFECCRR